MSGQEFKLQHTASSQEYREDEIDVAQLFSNIWRTKWRVLVSLLAIAALYATVLALNFLSSAHTTRYEQVFDLTFEGLSDGTFPDGSPFVMSEIVSPSILNRVYHANELNAHGLTLDEFRRAVSIEPYSPDYFLIRARYQQLLSSNNPSAAEIASLEERMQSDLSVAQSGSVRVSLQLPADREIPTTVAKKVIDDIPANWASRAIEERGVLSLNLPIYSERIFDESRFENLDYLIGIELLLENIALIQNNVQALKRQPNAANVVDEESGYNLEDLEKAIRDIEQYDLRQLIDPVKELGLTRNEDVVRLYYNRQLQDLALQKRFWEERARVTRETLGAYTRGGFRQSPPESNGQTGQTNQGNMTPQLGDAFLDRLVDISREGGEQEFRQSLTRNVLEYENEALDVERRIEEIGLTVAAIDGNRGTDNRLRQVYLEQVQNRLPAVLAVLREHTNIVGRLHEQLGRQAAGSVSQIIMPQGGSFQVVTGSPVERRHVLIFLALMIVTGFVSLVISLTYDMVRARKLQKNV